jgi:hypothetical protein
MSCEHVKQKKIAKSFGNRFLLKKPQKSSFSPIFGLSSSGRNNLRPEFQKLVDQN